MCICILDMYILLIAKHLGVICKRYFLVYLGMFVRGREMREQDQASMLQSGKNLEESRLNFSTCTSSNRILSKDTQTVVLAQECFISFNNSFKIAGAVFLAFCCHLWDYLRLGFYYRYCLCLYMYYKKKQTAFNTINSLKMDPVFP